MKNGRNKGRPRRLTVTALEWALDNRDASRLPVLGILREKRTSAIDGMTMWGWVAVTDPTDGGCTELTRRQAQELIGICGLVPAFESSDGTVYDTPSGAFRRENQGKTVAFV